MSDERRRPKKHAENYTTVILFYLACRLLEALSGCLNAPTTSGISNSPPDLNISCTTSSATSNISACTTPSTPVDPFTLHPDDSDDTDSQQAALPPLPVSASTPRSKCSKCSKHVKKRKLHVRQHNRLKKRFEALQCKFQQLSKQVQVSIIQVYYINLDMPSENTDVYVDSYLLKYILDECTYKVVNNDSVLICNVIFFSFQKGARESTTESDLEAEEKGYDFESDENEVSDPDEMSDGWLESDADSSEDSDWASLEDCAASLSDSSSETDEDRAEEESRNTVTSLVSTNERF